MLNKTWGTRITSFDYCTVTHELKPLRIVIWTSLNVRRGVDKTQTQLKAKQDDLCGRLMGALVQITEVRRSIPRGGD